MDSAGEGDVTELNSAIRATINDTQRIGSRLQADRVSWARLCSAMDTIADSDMALGTYLMTRAKYVSLGHTNLSFYGAMQALVVQQDAVRVLCESVGVPYPKNKVLASYRRFRDLSVGHPTHTTHHAPAIAVFVIQGSLLRGTPSIMIVNVDGSTKHEDIDVDAIVKSQRALLAERLTTALDHLRGQDMAHRRQYAGVKLASHLNLAQEGAHKVREELFRFDESNPLEGFQPYLGMVESGLADFEKDLKARGEWDARRDRMPDQFEYARHLVDRIRGIARSGQLTRKDEFLDARAFAEVLARIVDGLLDAATRMDDEYGGA